MLTELLPIIAGVSFGLTLIALLFGFAAYGKAMDAMTEVKALKSSTHSIQYVPAESSGPMDDDKLWRNELAEVHRDNLQGIEDIQTDLDELAEGTL